MSDHLTGSGPQPLWFVPFHRRNEFIGRTSELTRAENELFNTGGYSKVAINGLGGMGKTRLALEIAHRTKTERASCSVFWIQATDLASFERDCLKIGQLLQVPGITDTKEDVKLLLKQYLGSDKAGEWLLIIDNADDEELWI